MSDFTLQTSVCLAHSCLLVYRSDDGLIGLHVHSGGSKADRRRYFVWDWPDVPHTMPRKRRPAPLSSMRSRRDDDDQDCRLCHFPDPEPRSRFLCVRPGAPWPLPAVRMPVALADAVLAYDDRWLLQQNREVRGVLD